MFLRLCFSCVVVFFILSACDEGRERPVIESVSSHRGNARLKATFHKALELIEEGELKEASNLLNRTLQDFPKDPLLHLLNGRLYEEMADQGQVDAAAMAETAYKKAAQLDPSLWRAHYFLARLYLRQKNYDDAQEALANAILIKPRIPELYHELAVASYQAQDLETAGTMIEKALALLSPSSPNAPLFHRTASIIFAGLGQDKKAQEYLALFKQKRPQGHPDVLFIEERLGDWRAFYRDNQKPNTRAPITQKIKQRKSQEDSDPTIILDCYLLRMTEAAKSNKGFNLLSHFENLIISPRTITKTNQKSTLPGQSEYVRTFVSKITWGDISYSMNIMNAMNERVEVIARPTLSTFLNKRATFNSGQTVIGGIAGINAGTLASVPSGVIIEILPTDMKGDFITLDLSMEKSLLNFDPEGGGKGLSEQVIKSDKTTASTTMRLRFGETGMVSGFVERQDQETVDETPLLGDVPVVEYFFKQQTKNNSRVSVLFLVTPRKKDAMEAKVAHSVISRRKKKPALQELLRKTGSIWGAMLPNLDAILSQITPLSYQYRSEDTLPIFWGKEKTLFDEISKIEKFIYY